jgi:hypothetical protein
VISVIVNVKYLYKKAAMPKVSNKAQRKSNRNSNSPYATGSGRSTADVAESDDQAEDERQQGEQEVHQPLQPTISAEMAAVIKAKVDDLLASERAKDRMAGESSRLKSGSDQTAQQGQSDSQSDASNDTVLNKGRKRRQSKTVPKSRKSAKSKSKNVSQRSSKKSKAKPTSDEDASPEDEGDYSSVEDYETDSEEEPPRQSFGLLVGENLPAKQKEKIKQGKFVEMADLLPQNYTKKGNVVFKMTASKGMQALKQSGSTYVTLEQWNEAFDVFMAIRVEVAKTKQEAVALTKQMVTYRRDINSLAKQNLQWHLYDRMFRKDVSEQSTPVSFGTIRHDLMLQVNMLGARKQQAEKGGRDERNSFRREQGRVQGRWQGNQRSRSGSELNRGEGICFAYNARDRTCTYGNNCRFRHVCTSCRGQHQFFNCKQNQQSTTPGSQPGSAGAGRGQPGAGNQRQGPQQGAGRG